MSATQIKMERPTVFKLNNKIKELEAKNVEHIRINELYTDKIFELEEKLEIAVDFIKSVPDAHEHYGHELNSLCDDALTAIKGE